MYELSLLTGVGSVVMAGVFFAFSSFVMTALGNIQTSEGIRAMQRINIDVFSWSFAFLFFGVPIAAFVLGVYSIFNLSDPKALYYLMGSVIYLVGSFVVTGLGNVPLNNMLARIDSEASSAIDDWQKFIVTWTRWNHVRTGASLIAGLLFTSVSFI
ncbi:MAG: DUF1772 domain-containing protein [Gammaproteobacteria bacterium]|nr:DUF1772 domain-containing protein [Gammaproteobacteria bacterium]